MPSKPTRDNDRAKKRAAQEPQTLIIPKISPEVLEQARRAAQQGADEQRVEQEARQAAEEQARRQAEAETAAEAAALAAARAEAAKNAPAKPQPRSRAAAERELYQRIHDDHLWLNNPVMVRGLGLAPAVVAVSDAENAVMLCAAAVLMLTLTRVIAVAVCHLTGNRFRAMVYAFTAAVVYIPAYTLLYQWFGASLAVLGIYLPLMVVDPVIIKRMESDELETLGEALRRGINNTVGFCIAVMLVGILRELLAAGTVFDRQVLPYAVLPLAAQPAGGFLLLGVFAAVWTAIGGAYVRYKIEEVRHLYARRKKR